MKEKKPPVQQEKTEADISPAAETLMRMGEARAYFAIEKLSRYAKIKLLAELNETGDYKLIPGCFTMRDVFEAVNVPKTTGYKEIEAFKQFGEKAYKVICALGLSSHKISLLISDQLEVEDVEFEIVDQGKFRYKGKLISIDKNPREFEAALLELRDLEKVQRQARIGLEKKLAEEKKSIDKLQADIERKDLKIASGEQQLKDLDSTELNKKLIQLMNRSDIVLAHKWTKVDRQKAKKHWAMVDGLIREPLRRRFVEEIENLEFEEAGAPLDEEDK